MAQQALLNTNYDIVLSNEIHQCTDTIQYYTQHHSQRTMAENQRRAEKPKQQFATKLKMKEWKNEKNNLTKYDFVENNETNQQQQHQQPQQPARITNEFYYISIMLNESETGAMVYGIAAMKYSPYKYLFIKCENRHMYNAHTHTKYIKMFMQKDREKEWVLKSKSHFRMFDGSNDSLCRNSFFQSTKVRRFRCPRGKLLILFFPHSFFCYFIFLHQIECHKFVKF